jgi:hypothetical protein
MITATDALNCVECERYFVILPATPQWDEKEFIAKFRGRRCADGFHYSSDNNTEWLDVEKIRALIREHIDPKFTPWSKR